MKKPGAPFGFLSSLAGKISLYSQEIWCHHFSSTYPTRSPCLVKPSVLMEVKGNQEKASALLIIPFMPSREG